MPEQTLSNENEGISRILGINVEVTPLVGIGLGLTGLALGLRPRLAPLPLALTALAAALYRDPERATPVEASTLFAPADGTVYQIEEVYEHRFLHTVCLRISIATSALDVPVNRSPVAGAVRYFEHVSGENRPVASSEAAERNERVYIGVEAVWGPMLIMQLAGPLARRVVNKVQVGDQLAAGDRIGTMRFGARTDVFVQRDAVKPMVRVGQRVLAGVTRLAEVTAL